MSMTSTRRPMTLATTLSMNLSRPRLACYAIAAACLIASQPTLADKAPKPEAATTAQQAATQPATQQATKPAEPAQPKPKAPRQRLERKKHGPPAPIETYEKTDIDGWTVMVGAGVKADPKLREEALGLIRAQLFMTARLLPARAVERLKGVRIWLELEGHPGACFHVSPHWLKLNGYLAEKVGTVEIGDAREYITDYRRHNALLHEMTHAYHHHVLGFNHPEVLEAFQRAKQSGTYDKVLRSDGRTEKHYAMTDVTEYFAEASEAYFAFNDFYPFNRAELRQHDPQMEALLGRVWNQPAPARK